MSPILGRLGSRIVTPSIIWTRGYNTSKASDPFPPSPPGLQPHLSIFSRPALQATSEADAVSLKDVLLFMATQQLLPSPPFYFEWDCAKPRGMKSVWSNSIVIIPFRLASDWSRTGHVSLLWPMRPQGSLPGVGHWDIYPS